MTGAANPMSLNDTDLKLLSNIKANLKALNPILPNRAVVTIGRYALDLASTPSIKDEQTDLIRVHHKKDLEYKTIIPYPTHTLEINTEYEPHYWFDLYNQIKDDDIYKRIEKKIYRYHKNIYTITNIGEGTASGFLPKIHNFINQKQKNIIEKAANHIRKRLAGDDPQIKLTRGDLVAIMAHDYLTHWGEQTHVD